MKKQALFAAFFSLSVAVTQSFSQTWITDPQVVSKVWVQDDGGGNGSKIYIFTSENGGLWNIQSPGCSNQASLLVPASSGSKKEWLAVLLSAQASGAKVQIEFNPSSDGKCGTPPYSIKAIASQP